MNFSKVIAWISLCLSLPLSCINAQDISYDPELHSAISIYAMLNSNESITDVTTHILKDSSFSSSAKKHLIESKRRFVVFAYPSNGLLIKSMMSYVEDPGPVPLVVWLRGGSRLHAVPIFHDAHLTSDLILSTNATVVLACYRDGISQGIDEYGGADVNDVNSLYQFLPRLYSSLGLEFPKQQRFLVGISRGGMQMFLALARFPNLQLAFDKIVSISGILHIDLFAKHNPDWLAKMKKSFGYDGQQWLDKRNPFLAINHIQHKDLPMLIVQGTEDSKVILGEGILLTEKLRELGFKHVSYWEVGEANHGLKNHPEWMCLIRNWLGLPMH